MFLLLLCLFVGLSFDEGLAVFEKYRLDGDQSSFIVFA